VRKGKRKITFPGCIYSLNSAASRRYDRINKQSNAAALSTGRSGKIEARDALADAAEQIGGHGADAAGD
jgi:hypothetical protein